MPNYTPRGKSEVKTLRQYLDKQTQLSVEFASRKLALAIKSLRKHTQLSYIQIAKELELASPGSARILEQRYGGRQ